MIQNININASKEKIQSILITVILALAFPAILISIFAFLNYLPTLIPDTYESSMEWPLGGYAQPQLNNKY
ncbi:MAG: hypothetical protein KAI17_05835 [Thiotrichaceae bacterium]|nr:hypothetical protein [Thiotrichaceae bacterium]